MVELVPNSVDASGEKHTPVVDVADNKVVVNVGSVEFWYTKAYVPPKTAEVSIRYVADDGALDESEYVTVTEGEPYTAYARSYEGYELQGYDSVTVEVYSDGSVNVGSVELPIIIRASKLSCLAAMVVYAVFLENTFCAIMNVVAYFLGRGCA